MYDLMITAGVAEADAEIAANVFAEMITLSPAKVVAHSRYASDPVVRQIATLVLELAARYARENGQAAAA